MIFLKWKNEKFYTQLCSYCLSCVLPMYILRCMQCTHLHRKYTWLNLYYLYNLFYSIEFNVLFLIYTFFQSIFPRINITNGNTHNSSEYYRNLFWGEVAQTIPHCRMKERRKNRKKMVDRKIKGLCNRSVVFSCFLLVYFHRLPLFARKHKYSSVCFISNLLNTEFY